MCVHLCACVHLLSGYTVQRQYSNVTKVKGPPSMFRVPLGRERSWCSTASYPILCNSQVCLFHQSFRSFFCHPLQQAGCYVTPSSFFSQMCCLCNCQPSQSIINQKRHDRPNVYHLWHFKDRLNRNFIRLLVRKTLAYVVRASAVLVEIYTIIILNQFLRKIGF